MIVKPYLETTQSAVVKAIDAVIEKIQWLGHEVSHFIHAHAIPQAKILYAMAMESFLRYLDFATENPRLSCLIAGLAVVACIGASDMAKSHDINAISRLFWHSVTGIAVMCTIGSISAATLSMVSSSVRLGIL